MSIIRFDEFQKLNSALVAIQQQKALQRYIKRSNEREHIASELKTKSPFEVETPERIASRKALIHPRDGLAIERLIGQNDLFPISYLEAGLNAAKSVCRIEIRDSIGRVLGHGTGFLVSPSLLLTNNHVLDNEDMALFSLAEFNYELNLNLKERQIKSFRFAPKRLFITDVDLDFTLVAIEEESADGTKLSDFDFLPLLSQRGKALVGEYVSIVQHPSGAPKAVAIRENKITDIFDDYIHYSTDTMEGSSGSPVFNDEWIVIALHHAGVPDPNDNTKFISNEGIRISSILKFVTEQCHGLSDDKKKLVNDMLKDKKFIDHKLEEMLDEESTGYDTKFLGNNYEVPHPKFRSDLEQDIAPVKNGGNVLNYTHFSIVMSKSRRLAYYTAVNIDGKQLIDIKREKDKWHFDPRIETRFQCGSELYQGNDIDQGHLVRRRDPVWGNAAKEANEDTFHFTNCSPQHKNLNQKTWLDLENYILNNAENSKLKVTVFTGPIFRSDDIVYRGVQIPAEFWKIAVIVKEDESLSATAYLQSQKNLIDNLEFAYGEYKTYQIPVSKIEALTGLDFGNLRNHDPIARLESTIGHVIETSEDIKN
ncbi:DNA/RNA non-specific endonuclease [Bacillus sp. DX1.1]|uniref:DNA/RNA non-specific endonuclease n=1 Tax=unclassified Bacillus (in: firmicutes) TaxID=185979 RepID=UPI0025700ED1|nr:MULTISPECIES: DNA/RNA non-specific endonuclease [unclassified Bacillus (in: firmicutes)]MDM5154408.1 DNA/RNA non-specific endonuclease [Bacillus sp. DX1.1]WJE83314.1 DNA/RNA non-specific endonuclease [Bacillus sp. DX3.1]